MCPRRPWDHPRVCGEQLGDNVQMVDTTGSSPRVRGAVRDALATVDDVGIIPAHAGSSHPSSRYRRCSRDHPRACGEQTLTAALVSSAMGSSPRVRGAVCRCVCGICRVGIIPARAGSSTDRCAATSWRRDHPRACGEQFSLRMAQLVLSGSSPRVRGAGSGLEQRGRHRGIIPARAGSRSRESRSSNSRKDHPRACGEQLTRQRLP